MIAIKEMKMPKNCNRCPFYYVDDRDYIFSSCRALNRCINPTEDTRHKDCPLIEIKEREEK